MMDPIQRAVANPPRKIVMQCAARRKVFWNIAPLAAGAQDVHHAVHDGPHFAGMIESGPIPAVHGVVRWRLIDLAQWIFEEFRIAIAKQTLSRELRAMGYRKLSARPRHYAQAAGAIEDFKKRMARPVASDFVEYAVIGLLQRIRPRAQAPAKMEIRASRSS